MKEPAQPVISYRASRTLAPIHLCSFQMIPELLSVPEWIFLQPLEVSSGSLAVINFPGQWFLITITVSDAWCHVQRGRLEGHCWPSKKSFTMARGLFIWQPLPSVGLNHSYASQTFSISPRTPSMSIKVGSNSHMKVSNGIKYHHLGLFWNQKNLGHHLWCWAN